MPASHQFCHYSFAVFGSVLSGFSDVLGDFVGHWIATVPYSALEVFLNDVRYINSRFTYLLTYLLTVTEQVLWIRNWWVLLHICAADVLFSLTWSQHLSK